MQESDDDEIVRKTTLREVKVLRSLKQDNIVNLKVHPAPPSLSSRVWMDATKGGSSAAAVQFLAGFWLTILVGGRPS